MSIEGIKQELANLDEASRHHIMAYLISIDDQNNPEHMAEMARLIDDKNPANWLTLEEFDRKLSLNEDEKAE